VEANYRRTLSADEQDVLDESDAAELAEELAEEAARRDRYFGFAGGMAKTLLFSSMEAETCETSAPLLPDEVAARGG
jgi:hypothetical protein